MTVRLVLADDHRMLRESLRRSLEDEGLDVVGEAGTGEEAVSLAGQVDPDVVLMDVTMPGAGGVAATRQIRDRFPDVKVVMLTMHADREVVAEALAAGASGYLVKDCSIDEIADTVRRAADADQSPLSKEIAASMLAEIQRLGVDTGADEERVITKREEEVLQLIADGCSTPEVAARLYISQKTVKNHLASIYQKLDARDRTQAVLQAVRMGIVHLR
ncbi:MAG: response regulator transcription factor [Actinobacteria bacterium]|nr:response regulator transcription factor [Actinomycetota bacterium]